MNVVENVQKLSTAEFISNSANKTAVLKSSISSKSGSKYQK